MERVDLVTLVLDGGKIIPRDEKRIRGGMKASYRVQCLGHFHQQRNANKIRTESKPLNNKINSAVDSSFFCFYGTKIFITAFA